MSETAIQRLQAWFHEQCDGDWEHTWGLTIETLDNPGWKFSVDLEASGVEGRDFDWVKLERSEHDWLFFRSTGSVFEAACGPLNLEETLEQFLDFISGAGRGES